MQGGSAVDPLYIQAGLIFPYVNNVAVYRCPADHTVYPLGNSNGRPRVRSMSMNCWMDPLDIWDTSAAPGVNIFKRATDINNPSTSMAFVFIDENPSSIDDGYFAVNILKPNFWVNAPATYHNGAGGLSYADGHAEIKKWTDTKVLGDSVGSNFASDPNSQDWAWLDQRATSKQ